MAKRSTKGKAENKLTRATKELARKDFIASGGKVGTRRGGKGGTFPSGIEKGIARLSGTYKTQKETLSKSSRTSSGKTNSKKK